MSTERFDKAAEGWDAKPRRVELATIIAKAISSALPLSKEMTGLEFGCGTGLVTFALAEQMGKMYGLDNSSGMITVLQEKIAKLGVSNVAPLHGTLHNLTEKVDLIVISMTLHHIKDYKSLIAECFSQLRSGGFLAIADLEMEDGSFHKDNDGIAHFGFDLDVLCKEVKKLSFVTVETQVIHNLDRNEREYPIFLLTALKK